MSDNPECDEPPPIHTFAELLRNSYTFLGFSNTVLALGAHEQQLYGKWCQRCQGIWFGLALEVQCPRCGNRKG
jgi:hypothetical protein